MYAIFSGDDYYPGGGWDDHDRTCATMDEARLAIMKLKGDWLHIVDLDSGKQTDFRYANNQWNEDTEEFRAAEKARINAANAKLARSRVPLPPDEPFCGNCTISFGMTPSYCTCGKFG